MELTKPSGLVTQSVCPSPPSLSQHSVDTGVDTGVNTNNSVGVDTITL